MSNLLLKALETAITFGNTKVQLYVPVQPMTYEEIVAEAKRLGIYKEWKQGYGRRLVNKVGLTAEVHKNQGSIHYTFTPIKLRKKKRICLDTWHPVDNGGKPASDGSSKRDMANSVWNDGDGAAFLFRCIE